MTGGSPAAEPPITPERTFALVVGVEAYELDTRLRLAGPARDAVRFADWLTGTAGVPEGNVHLLLSPLADGEVAAHAKPATQRNVEDALFTDLPRCDGDLLWIYWAGHGFMNRQRHLLLPYADATAGQVGHLNLTSALHLWQSTTVGGGRFRRTVTIGDACRIDTARLKLNFPQVNYTAGDSTRRMQFTLYAARPGQAAMNDGKGGQFTDTLLGRLEGRTLEEATLGLAGIARDVQADFAVMKANGTAWQEPQFEIAVGWDGSSLYGDHWTQDGTAAEPSGGLALDQTAWTELGQLVSEKAELPRDTYAAYRWAFEATGCVPPVEHTLPAEHLTGIVHDLEDRQGTRRSVPLALPFIKFLASRADPSPWVVKANAWVERTRKRLGAAAVPLPPPRAAEPPALHIRLTPDDEKDSYRLQLWSYEKDFDGVGDHPEPMSLDAIRTALGEHLLAHAASQPGRIEIHVPYDLLTVPFETWLVPNGRRSGTAILGCRYEVVLRCPEERLGSLGEAPWLAKWQWYETNGGLHPDAVHDVSDTHVSDRLAYELQRNGSPVCVLAEVTEELVTDALGAVFDGGIPIAVWRRPSTTPGTPIRTALEGDPPEPLDVASLPSRLQRAQVERHPLALLYDNPGRIPPTRSLS
ncbi:VMAP-C domain-containing protein [Streptomyces sp. NPDC003832]